MATIPDITWSSDRTIRIHVAETISAEASELVRRAHRQLHAARIPAVVDVTPAYTTVLVTFDPLLVEPGRAEAAVRRALQTPLGDSATADALPRTVEIPVCYGGEFGPDLADVAASHGLSPAAVVELHAGGTYSVSFLGFSPGFGYLAGLPARIHTPRLAQPRTRVPAGSVAIGGEQTGVYPRSSPGGWRIIGRTPRVMFDAGRAEPSLLRMGDRVRFVPVSSAEFNQLAGDGA